MFYDLHDVEPALRADSSAILAHAMYLDKMNVGYSLSLYSDGLGCALNHRSLKRWSCEIGTTKYRHQVSTRKTNLKSLAFDRLSSSGHFYEVVSYQMLFEPIPREGPERCTDYYSLCRLWRNVGTVLLPANRETTLGCRSCLVSMEPTLIIHGTTSGRRT